MRPVARMGEGWRAEDWEERLLVRPLLDVDKVDPFLERHLPQPADCPPCRAQARLVATCEAEGLPYAFDPTNLDPSHTPRNRLRAQIAHVQSDQLTHPHRMCSDVQHAGPGGPLALLQRSARQSTRRPSPPGVIEGFVKCLPQDPMSLFLRPARLSPALSPSSVRSLLKQAISHVAPEQATLSVAALEDTRLRLFGLPSRFSVDGMIGPGLGDRPFTPGAGVLLTPPSSALPGAWTLSRQPARRGDARSMALVPGQGMLWDNRVWVKLETSDEGPIGAMRCWVEERGAEGLAILVNGAVKGLINWTKSRDGQVTFQDGDARYSLQWRRRVWGAGNGGWADDG